MNIKDVINAWNSQADGFNQWDSLDTEEQINFALQQERIIKRYDSSKHIIPLLPCPMCGGLVDFVCDDEQMLWSAECIECGLNLPGYSSRLDLCFDWNKRE